jgi:hypothetical protein
MTFLVRYWYRLCRWWQGPPPIPPHIRELLDKPRDRFDVGWEPPVDGADFIVQDGCYQTYPCWHGILYFGEKEPRFLSGRTIANMYRDRDLPVPEHFVGY